MYFSCNHQGYLCSANNLPDFVLHKAGSDQVCFGNESLLYSSKDSGHIQCDVIENLLFRIRNDRLVDFYGSKRVAVIIYSLLSLPLVYAYA